MDNKRFAEVVAEVANILAQHPGADAGELLMALDDDTSMAYEEDLMANVYEKVKGEGYYLEPSVQQYSGSVSVYSVSVYEVDDVGDPVGGWLGEYDFGYETVCMLELISESNPDLGPEDFYTRAADFLVGMCRDLE